jgi:NHLM bacteriocin system ABC transporter ATP-binding protein
VSRELGASTPLPLDEPGAAWVVATGRVEIFAVDAEGARRPLCAVGQGGLVLAPPAGTVRLLAVATEPGTTVDALADSAPLLEGWLTALADCVTAGVPDGSAVVDGPTTLEAGATAYPAAGLLWLAPGDDLALFGRESIGTEIALPVPPRAWVRAVAPTSVAPIDGELALASSAGWAGVDAFHHAVLAELAAQLDAEAVEAAARVERRSALDEELRADAYTRLAGVLRGRVPQAVAEDAAGLTGAFHAVAAHMGMHRDFNAPQAGASEEPIDAIARAAGLRIRRVALTARWWRSDVGTLIGTRLDDGRAIAIVPVRTGLYDMVDAGRRTRIDDKVAGTIAPDAFAVYRPLPREPVDGHAVRRFVLAPLRNDLARLVAYGIAAALLTLITPLVADTIFSQVVPARDHGNLIWLSALLAAVSISAFGFVLAQQIAILRMEGRTTIDLQAALWDRLLDLPLPFFRRFSAGALTMRVLGIAQIRQLATAAIATAALAVPVAVANLALAFFLEPRLAAFGLIVIVLVLAAMVALARYQVHRNRIVQRETRELFATSMQLVEAIGKLRVANAETRGFARWAVRFSTLKHAFGEAQVAFVMTSSLIAALSALGIVVVLLGAATVGPDAIGAARFLAFNTAYIQALAGVTTVAIVAAFAAQAVPIYEGTKPILAEPRETDEIRRDPGRLRGAVDVSNVSLRYADDAPLVLDGVSFSVDPGEFVAIVGPSGAGKSSLLRLLLGFEQPELGHVSYDGEDLNNLDARAVRRQMGVVLQTARLLPGDILRNIIGARQLTVEDAWEAAEIAGIADDIRGLPMGMQTPVAEGAATFSGGQRQRLLIARGVAGRPRILIFDEATSALDNRTQAHVAEAIARLRTTRIVIAHRLSTVRACDRILVMEAGRVVQSGPFADLVSTDGPFARLAARQLV